MKRGIYKIEKYFYWNNTILKVRVNKLKLKRMKDNWNYTKKKINTTIICFYIK